MDLHFFQLLSLDLDSAQLHYSCKVALDWIVWIAMGRYGNNDTHTTTIDREKEWNIEQPVAQ